MKSTHWAKPGGNLCPSQHPDSWQLQLVEIALQARQSLTLCAFLFVSYHLSRNVQLRSKPILSSRMPDCEAAREGDCKLSNANPNWRNCGHGIHHVLSTPRPHVHTCFCSLWWAKTWVVSYSMPITSITTQIKCLILVALRNTMEQHVTDM